MTRSGRHHEIGAGACDSAAAGIAGLLGLSALILGQAALGRILLLISP